METKFDIQSYMTKGIERLVKDTLKATFKNPKESAYMVKFAHAAKIAAEKREEEERNGVHIPPFLIASITSSCNLHCAGCYSRCTSATCDEKPVAQLNTADWKKIFDEANDLGISFILLAGGEPLLRRDVIKEAGERPDILFPVFTNGTYMDEEYFELFDRCRNIVPIMSIEGGKEATDNRRGEGVYDKLIKNMDEIYRRKLVFGVSVTVTTENIKDVASKEFLDSLEKRGCKAVIYVEYVPVSDESQELAPTDEHREYLKEQIARLRVEREEMVFVSFPGDEKSSGGCIAAGRGFFHINSHGGAEPCPFSPYSDINVKETSLKDAITSKLFMALQSEDILKDDHNGGCVLFEKRDQVEAILAQK